MPAAYQITQSSAEPLHYTMTFGFSDSNWTGLAGLGWGGLDDKCIYTFHMRLLIWRGQAGTRWQFHFLHDQSDMTGIWPIQLQSSRFPFVCQVSRFHTKLQWLGLVLFSSFHVCWVCGVMIHT